MSKKLASRFATYFIHSYLYTYFILYDDIHVIMCRHIIDHGTSPLLSV